MQEHASWRLNTEVRVDFRVRQGILNQFAHLLQELFDSAQVPKLGRAYL